MEQHFPKLDPAVNLPHQTQRSFGKTKSYHYYKALHNLKEVTRQLHSVNNRIKILTSKQSQASHPISEYFEEKGKQMRSVVEQLNQRSKQSLSKVRELEHQVLSKRQLRNYESRHENSQRREKAKRVITEQKYKSHDSVRQHSLQNTKAIHNAKMQSLFKKKQQYCEVVQFEKKSRRHIRQFSQSKISNLIQSRQAQTNKILNKLKQKEKILNEKKEECVLKEASIEKIKRQKQKPRKVYPRRLFTQESKSTLLFGTNASYTPRSALSFVIIP